MLCERLRFHAHVQSHNQGSEVSLRGLSGHNSSCSQNRLIVCDLFEFSFISINNLQGRLFCHFHFFSLYSGRSTLKQKALLPSVQILSLIL